MESIGDGETFFVNVVLEDGEGTVDEEESGGTQSKVKPLTPEEVYRRWLERQKDESGKAGLTVLVLRRSTSCGRRGAAGWPKGMAKMSKKKKMPG